MKLKNFLNRIFSQNSAPGDKPGRREDTLSEVSRQLWRVFDSRWTLINIRSRASAAEAEEKCLRAMKARLGAEMKLYGEDWRQAEKCALEAALRLLPTAPENTALLAEKLIRMAEISAERFDDEQNIRQDMGKLNALIISLRQGEKPETEPESELCREYAALFAETESVFSNGV